MRSSQTPASLPHLGTHVQGGGFDPVNENPALDMYALQEKRYLLMFPFGRHLELAHIVFLSHKELCGSHDVRIQHSLNLHQFKVGGLSDFNAVPVFE